MPAPTRNQAWAEPTIKEPTGNAGLPAPAPESGRIAVFPRRELAREIASTAEKRQFPFRLLSFVVVVALPTILAGVYYFLIAADQYVAEFRFALRTVEPVRIDPGSILGAAAPSPVGVDSYAVVQYIGSRDILDDLGRTLDLREMPGPMLIG
jgi:capsular polysaccharide transport system permease protein